MIDSNLPLELDDGTAVELHRVDARLNKIYVILPKGASVYRSGAKTVPTAYWYRLDEGIYGGGSLISHKVLRNVDLDEYEEDLV